MSDLLDLKHCQQQLPVRQADAHKGDFGHVLVVGGNYGMAGAVNMTAHASARVGAGLVSVATRPEHAYALAVQRPELMACGIETVADLDPLLSRATVIALGPGLGRDQWAEDLFNYIIEQPRPKVIDADALYFLGLKKTKLIHAIITPHVGEAAHLLGVTSNEIQSDRVAAIKSLQANCAEVCILKGAGTLVLGATLKQSPYAVPAMATGGMGDVLTGVIAGLVAQGLTLETAA